MNTVEIEHKINSTHMEIYEFVKHGNTYYYSGIMFSNRNDENDIWGHNWRSNKILKACKMEEVRKLAEKNGYYDVRDFEDVVWNCYGLEGCSDKLRAIDRKYNPAYNKTKSLEPYYHGVSWGINASNYKAKYPPKLTEKQIKNRIIKKVSKIKVKL